MWRYQRELHSTGNTKEHCSKNMNEVLRTDTSKERTKRYGHSCNQHENEWLAYQIAMNGLQSIWRKTGKSQPVSRLMQLLPKQFPGNIWSLCWIRKRVSTAGWTYRMTTYPYLTLSRVEVHVSDASSIGTKRVMWRCIQYAYSFVDWRETKGGPEPPSGFPHELHETQPILCLGLFRKIVRDAIPIRTC